jgi:Cd2+/Zn2+-exporting ATPase/Cu+-exporting ATPase
MGNFPSAGSTSRLKFSLPIPGKVASLRLLGIALAIGLTWLHLVSEPWLERTIAVVAVVTCGYPILAEALSALWRRRMSMELSMVIALLAALAIGEVLTALVIVFFVLVAEEIEHATVTRGRRSIKSLLDFLPRTAQVRRDGGISEVELSTVKAGDIVVVKPGGRLVVDGTVVSGHSFVDESAITGESLPREKVPGATVFAGTINQSGVLEIEAQKVGQETTFGQIVQAVEEAEKSRAVIQKTADRLAGYLVFFAFGAAALTLLVTHDITQTISVVIVAGACGIVAGTPLAILGSIGRAARQGSIVKGGLYIERLGQVDTIAFDKTGTLTLGDPQVLDIICADGVAPETVLATAAVAESFSEHPLAKAIMAKHKEHGMTAVTGSGFSYIPGRGVSCLANGDRIAVGNRSYFAEAGIRGGDDQLLPNDGSEVLVARNGVLLGRLHIADSVRPDAASAVARLKALKLKTVLLSGDAKPIAEAVAKQLGIDEVIGGLSPDEKRLAIAKMQRGGHKVAMVGDGVNDAPALTEAEVGVAVGSATDVALESADIMLIGNDLLKFVETIAIARKCRRVIYTNFVGTLVVDSVGMVLAMVGVLNPLVAGLVHVGSELAFILNSVRLFPMFQHDSERKNAA